MTSSRGPRRSPRPPPPTRWTYDNLRVKATAFLNAHWPTGKIPVDIEHIVDVVLGIEIVPVDHLLDEIEIDGYLSADRQTLFVDADTYSHRNLHRYRFTLAHEIAHYYLHPQLFAAAKYDDLDSFRDFQAVLRGGPYSWYEWQANCFAGLILVPTDQFREVLNRALEWAADRGLDADLSVEAHRDYVAEWIGRRFEVSGEVTLRRGKYEKVWNYP